MTAVGVAVPIAAAEEGDAETWTMPDTENSMLKNAVAATYEAAGTENIEFEYSFSDVTQVVYNGTNWRVCGQSPAADEEVEVTAEPATVEFELAGRVTVQKSERLVDLYACSLYVADQISTTKGPLSVRPALRTNR